MLGNKKSVSKSTHVHQYGLVPVNVFHLVRNNKSRNSKMQPKAVTNCAMHCCLRHFKHDSVWKYRKMCSSETISLFSNEIEKLYKCLWL